MKRPCNYPGCPGLVTSGYCDKHKGKTYQARPDNQKAYSWKWRQAAIRYLASHQLCVMCEGKGEVKAARCVDHITPHKGDMKAFWDVNNWQALCIECHSVKTARENRI